MRDDERDDEHPDTWSAAEAATVRAFTRAEAEASVRLDGETYSVSGQHWSEIAPADAVDIDLTAPEWAHIVAPRNEEGERCPWPWDPQQLAGAPIGQYHCKSCGAMVVAGVPHPDYGDET